MLLYQTNIKFFIFKHEANKLSNQNQNQISIFCVWHQDKLQREERNTAVNLLKLNEGWRSILRQTRTVELREDIAVLSQTFERRLDALDSIIRVNDQLLLLTLIAGHQLVWLPVCLCCRIWRATCRRRSVRQLRCGGFTCSIWSVCVLSETNGWCLCSSSGRTACSTSAPCSALRGQCEASQRHLQTDRRAHYSSTRTTNTLMVKHSSDPSVSMFEVLLTLQCPEEPCEGSDCLNLRDQVWNVNSVLVWREVSWADLCSTSALWVM